MHRWIAGNRETTVYDAPGISRFPDNWPPKRRPIEPARQFGAVGEWSSIITMPTGNARLKVDGLTYEIPSNAQVKRLDRAHVAWVRIQGTVYVLSGDGQLVVGPAEQRQLDESWDLL